MPNPGAPPLSQILGPPPGSQRPTLAQIFSSPDQLQAGGAVAGGLMNALNPTNFGSDLQNVAQTAGKVLSSSGFKNISGAVPSQQDQQQAAQQMQQGQQQQQQAEGDANAAFITPDATANAQGQTPNAQAIESSIPEQNRIAGLPGQAIQAGVNFEQNANKAALSGVQNAVGQISQAGGDNELGGAFSGVDHQGNQLDATGKILAAGQGIADIGAGGIGLVSAIPGAIINQIPGVSDIVKGGIGALNGAMGAVTNHAQQALGIDPNSQQGKTLTQLMQNLGQGVAMKVIGDTSHATGQASGLADAQSALDAAKASGDPVALAKATENLQTLQGKAVLNPPTTTGQMGAKIVGGAQDLLSKGLNAVGEIGGKIQDFNPPPNPLSGNGGGNDYFKLDKATQTKVDAIQSLAKQYPKLNQLIQDAQAKGFDPVTDLAKSNLLNGDADNPIISDGKINTTAGVNQINEFLKPYEGVISSVLEKEGKTMPLGDVKAYLEEGLQNSGLTGARLNSALTGLKGEIKGLAQRSVDSEGRPWSTSNENNDAINDVIDSAMGTSSKPQAAGQGAQVPLSELQKMKTDLYQNLNYTDGSAPAAKINASTLKGLIEDNTDSVNVKDLNNELAKHYTARDLLETLNNKVVKGGKLGKYFSKIGGQIAGGAVGSLLGPFGEAGGAIAGGKVADFIQQQQMNRVFGGNSGTSPIMSPAMQGAVGATSS